MQPITMQNLEAVVARINRLMGEKSAPYTKLKRRGKGGRRYRPNVGAFFIDSAYGGWTLHRMTTETGGVTDVMQCGYVSKRELYHLLFAFIGGIYAERERTKRAGVA